MSDESITELIARRRRQILVHSALYYSLNENIIDDHVYDAWSKELAELQASHQTESASAVYAKEFEGFDGSTGYDLPFHYPEIQSTAIKLLRYHKRRSGG